MKHVTRADRVSTSEWRHADSARSNGVATGGGAGTMARAFRKAGTWGWCREWEVIRQQSTFDPINLLSRTSLTRMCVWTFLISKTCPIILKRKGPEGRPSCVPPFS